MFSIIAVLFIIPYYITFLPNSRLSQAKVEKLSQIEGHKTNWFLLDADSKKIFLALAIAKISLFSLIPEIKQCIKGENGVKKKWKEDAYYL